uniref:Protein kinase domain-containing protein n=1 Tax=Arcella intermedia TaxID=1963864 RepID=A0A6B2LA44_9EUKA
MSPAEVEDLEEEAEYVRLKKLKKMYLSYTDPRKKYNITNQNIGKGSVGEVFFATRGDTKFAIKKLELIRRGRNRLPLILREIEIIATSAHPNIVQYIETFDMGEELWVVMEYMSGGSLYDIVKLFNTGTKLTESETAYTIHEVLEALSFLHSRNRIHRDIKVDNILLSRNGDVKLADFGTAVQLTFQRLQRDTMAGTPYYMAPELIKRQPYKEKVDIWSVGITIVELMTGRPPYYHLEAEEALEAIVRHGVRGLIGNGFSGAILEFTNKGCLAHNPQSRPTAKDLLKHPFLQLACTKQQFSHKLDVISSRTHEDEHTHKGCALL